MGFEVHYSYYDKENDDYKKDELKTFKKKVGDPFEDVSLEKLSASIMGQLARRDVFIKDVEIFELSRKKVSFKETKSGLVIKNRKISFDSIDESNVSVLKEEEKEPIKQVIQQSPIEEKVSKSQIKNKRPLSTVVFDPPIQYYNDIKQKGFKLTKNKKYEVFQKKMSKNGIGEVYLILDDSSKEQYVPDEYFIPAFTSLIGDDSSSSSPVRDDGPDLLWDGVVGVDSSMPNLRSR